MSFKKGYTPYNKGLPKEQQPMYGRKASEPTKEKQRLAKLGKHFTEAHRKNISKGNTGKKCPWAIPPSRKGSISSMRGKKQPKIAGEKHWNWKGGITPEIVILRGSLEHTLWRLEVYKRDNRICRICKKKCLPNDIIAHHLKLFSEFPELRFSVDNGITVCRSCHAKIHYKNATNN